MSNDDRGSELAAGFTFNEGIRSNSFRSVCAIVTAQGAVILNQ
jgi:hypothetical protein